MADEVRILVPEGEAPATAHLEGALAGGGTKRRLKGGFWGQKWVQEVVPWATSSVLHVTIVVFVIVFYQAIQTWQPRAVEQVIPDALVQEEGPVGGTPNPGLEKDPLKLAAQDQVLNSPEKKLQVEGQRMNEALAAGANSEKDAAIGIGPAGGFAKGIGTGRGGANSGGPFGPAGGSGAGIPVNFIGVRGNAQKVVFLCDSSGTMISIFPALQRQLRISVESLKIPQQFGIIFFSDSVKAFTPQLTIATPDNKKKAYDFLDQMAASGPTLPKNAIAQAFAMQPQLIFVLTDGFDQGDPAEVAAQFRRLNVGKKVKINTILIHSTEDPKLVEVLKGIAADNGGTYKEVDKQDF